MLTSILANFFEIHPTNPNVVLGSLQRRPARWLDPKTSRQHDSSPFVSTVTCAFDCVKYPF